MTIRLAGDNIDLLAVLIVNFLLGLVLGLAFYGALHIGSRVRKTQVNRPWQTTLLKIVSIFVGLSVALTVAIIPATIWKNAEAYYSGIGVLVFFAVLAPITIFVIYDASKR